MWFVHQSTFLLQIFPGGKLQAKNLYVNVDALYVDVMGSLTTDGQGYCDMSKYFLLWIQHYAVILGTERKACSLEMNLEQEI